MKAETKGKLSINKLSINVVARLSCDKTAAMIEDFNVLLVVAISCFVLVSAHVPDGLQDFVSQEHYELSGEDFHQNFMAKHKALLIQSSNEPSASIYDKNGILNENLKDTEVSVSYDTSTEAKTLTLASFENEKFYDIQFQYDITKGSSKMQQSITLPSMMVSCRGLYEDLQQSLTAMLFGAKKRNSAEIVKCSSEDAVLKVIKGNFSIGFPGKVGQLQVKSGDLLYIPPNQCLNLKLEGYIVYINYTWTRSSDDEAIVNCGRPSMHSLTKDLIVNSQNLHVDNTLPDIQLNTGYSIPPVGLGTARLFENTYETVKIALELGYNLIDTAQIYSGEKRLENFNVSSEEEIGRAIADSEVDRSGLFIVTKVDSEYMSRDGTIAKVEESLRKLRTDYLDLLLVHDFDTDGCEPYDKQCKSSPWICWRTLEELQSRGVARSIGVSNIFHDELEYLLKEFAKSKVSVVQNWFDPFHQDIQVRKICADNGVRYMAHSTLGKMWTDESSLGYDVNPVLNHVTIIGAAASSDQPVTSYVLRWAMENDVIVIPCSTKTDHLEKNLSSRDLSVQQSKQSNLADLDNEFGNPDDEDWVKKDFPKEIFRDVHQAQPRDEL